MELVKAACMVSDPLEGVVPCRPDELAGRKLAMDKRQTSFVRQNFRTEYDLQRRVNLNSHLQVPLPSTISVYFFSVQF